MNNLFDQFFGLKNSIFKKILAPTQYRSGKIIHQVIILYKEKDLTSNLSYSSIQEEGLGVVWQTGKIEKFSKK